MGILEYGCLFRYILLVYKYTNKMCVFIYGINSFIGRNLYLKLKNEKVKVFCFNHSDVDKLTLAGEEDIIINFCGVNRGESVDDYYNANTLLVENMVSTIKKSLNGCPFFVHISSLMVHGFEGKNTDELPEYQKNFIGSKLAGEMYLEQNYPTNKFAIVRPSNIYGYNCEPYYNNLLVTLVHEKITNNFKTNKINKNCVRNFLSIDGLVGQIMEIITNRKHGIYNILSNNNTDLHSLVNMIHGNIIPDDISIVDGEKSVTSLNPNVGGINIIIEEDLAKCIIFMEEKMKKLMDISSTTSARKLERLSQPRGDMVEISSVEGKRLYMITLTENSIRGNHFHFEQIEDFYVAKGKVIFLLAHKDDTSVVFFKILDKDGSIVVKPNLIHTLVNDFVQDPAEVYVVSTQKFIKNEIPDTKYLNIIPY